MNKETIDHVLVVGGGTAGWLTAAKLAKQFNCRAPGAIRVTLVESPDIPTIGVGEGTWPTMRKTLEGLGIDEGHFMRSCCATFKQGTRFVNWQTEAVDGQPRHYHNLFTSIYDPTEFNLAPYWKLGLAGKNTCYADAVSVQSLVCDEGLAPKKITHKAYEGMQNYAYHLDAGKFAELLKDHAINNLGVMFISANVNRVVQADNKAIVAVETDVAGTLTADFFVDCSGFRSLLLGDTLKVPFHPINDLLLTDHAVTIQVPYDDPQAALPSSTLSTAQEAGWIWDIGLSNRRGVGYVYSSRHTSHEQAEQCLRDYIGTAAKGLMARKLKMDIGYREKFWQKNCVAIGLSAAFIEPLEASAIFLIEAAANMLCDQFPRSRQALVHAERKFNQSFHFRWLKTIDFIKMHYVLSNRQGQFWNDNKQASTIPDTLKQALAHWAVHPMSSYDFPHINEPFPLESYQYVLYGMGFPQELAYNAASFAMTDKAAACFERIRQIRTLAAKELPTNRELLNKVYQHGFQTL